MNGEESKMKTKIRKRIKSRNKEQEKDDHAPPALDDPTPTLFLALSPLPDLTLHPHLTPPTQAVTQAVTISQSPTLSTPATIRLPNQQIRYDP
jgi:hypothetical protein